MGCSGDGDGAGTYLLVLHTALQGTQVLTPFPLLKQYHHLRLSDGVGYCPPCKVVV